MKRKSNSNRFFFFFMSSNLSMLRHSENKQCDHVRKKQGALLMEEWRQTFMTTKVWVERKRGLRVSNSSSCSSSIGMVYFSS